VPDRPATRRADRDPLPFRPSAAGCAFSVHVHAGQWGSCEGRPAVTGVWTSPRRERWRVFGCVEHAARLADDPECSDVGPLDDAARAELAGRCERWQAALDGKGWRPERPMEPMRPRWPLQGNQRS
jgi:hypothetical protein